MKRGDKVGMVACSNPIGKTGREKIQALEAELRMFGLSPIYRGEAFVKCSGKARAEALMKFYEEKEVSAVFDLSGGDLANEILPYLDYKTIAESEIEFWGYSDLTTVINAIYAKTGKTSVLYQVRNLTGKYGMWKKKLFFDSVFTGSDALFAFDHEFLQGEELQGIVVGGNIRCLLKLAGTPYWPDMQDKILFLEARSGQEPQIQTYFAQLSQIGVFEQVRGVILGTFTQLEQEEKDAADLIGDCIPKHIPVARTWQIGHGADSQALRIGAEIHLKKS